MNRPRTTSRATTKAALALVVALATVAAACGGDDDDAGQTGSSASAATTAAPSASSGPSTTRSGAPQVSVGTTAASVAASDVDPQGVLRIPFDLAGLQASFDPVGVTAPFFWHFAVYDTLLRMDDAGAYAPGLARNATIVDGSTITVELNPGLTFQDGTPLDSAAVKATIERNAASNKPGIFRLAELSQISSIDIESPTNFTIRLATPIAGSFFSLLAHGETMPVSPTAIANGVDLRSNPVGAGPFKVESFNAPESVKLVKWDGYFEAAKIRLAGIEFVNVSPDPNALVGALRTHAVDGSGTSQVTLDTVAQLGGDVSTFTRTSENGTIFISLQCETFPAFQDVRVRQALNFATDKEALNNLILQGKGQPMSQFWSAEAPWYNPALTDTYPYDRNRATALLAEAGVTDLSFKMAISPGTIQRIGEAVQAQWAQVGINVELVPIRDAVTEYYIGKQQDSFPTLQNRIWTDKITRNFVAGSTGNTCDPKSEDFNTRLATLRAVDPRSPAAVPAWADVSSFITDNAQGVFLMINVLNYAWDDDRVGDVAWTIDQVGGRYLDWHKVYIKK